ncbi:hypothetical protein HFO32_22155 [Rhizobium leguminosarum]|uniref:hypothetical protein n=1 Tax=Rhizobium leguminosarum TaxID=384 RepID=UPI001C95BCB4|nr:hypothetical protein [Rhizobium leguminosarum]MBY5684829.1 hypothetical protein [Rhizobium leguminosarum]
MLGFTPAPSQGRKTLKSETIIVGTDVDSLTEAFEYLDKHAHIKNAKFVVKMPSSEADHFQEFLDLRDDDYSNVTVEGAVPLSATSTSVVFSGAVPSFSITFNFNPSAPGTTDFIAAAVKAGAVVVHAAGDPGTAADGCIAGFWPVTSTTASSITLAIKIRGTISATTLSTQSVLLQVLSSMFKPKVVGGAKKGLIAAVDSVAPRLKWLGFNGGRYDGDAGAVVINGENSLLRFGEADSINIDPGLAVTGAKGGLGAFNATRANGIVIISDCSETGVLVGYGASYMSKYAITTGNITHGAMVSQTGVMAVSPFNGSPLSAFSGNGVNGLVVQESAWVHSISMHCASNAAAAQIMAQNNAWLVMGGTTQATLIGSSSPNANIAGNSNAYIKRY